MRGSQAANVALDCFLLGIWRFMCLCVLSVNASPEKRGGGGGNEYFCTFLTCSLGFARDENESGLGGFVITRIWICYKEPY